MPKSGKGGWSEYASKRAEKDPEWRKRKKKQETALKREHEPFSASAKPKRQLTEKQHAALKNANAERRRQGMIRREQKQVARQNAINSTLIRKRSAARAKKRQG